KVPVLVPMCCCSPMVVSLVVPPGCASVISPRKLLLVDRLDYSKTATVFALILLTALSILTSAKKNWLPGNKTGSQLHQNLPPVCLENLPRLCSQRQKALTATSR